MIGSERNNGNFIYEASSVLAKMKADGTLAAVQECDVEWHRMQCNGMDRKTNGIYDVTSIDEFDEFLKRKGIADDMGMRVYAFSRFTNLIRSRIDEEILCAIDGVRKAEDWKDRSKDISVLIDGKWVDYDVKSTVNPDKYEGHEALENAVRESIEGSDGESKVSRIPRDISWNVIEWLYERQSRQARFGLNNRLFVMTVPVYGERWKDIAFRIGEKYDAMSELFSDRSFLNEFSRNGFSTQIIFVTQDKEGRIQCLTC